MKGISQVKLLIAGARPANAVKKLNQHLGVTVRGWVDDIREAYRDGCIFVAPMFSGLGLQNKILEAMASGLPCITTSMVNNALGATKGTQILVADTLEDIIFLLDNVEETNKIASEGMKFVEENYRWEDQVGKLNKVLHAKNIF